MTEKAKVEHKGIALPEGMTPALLDHWITILNDHALKQGDPKQVALRLFNEVPAMGAKLKSS